MTTFYKATFSDGTVLRRSTASRNWEISNIDGSNKRAVTLAQYRAEIEAAKQRVRPVVDALRRGDHDGMAKAQNNTELRVVRLTEIAPAVEITGKEYRTL